MTINIETAIAWMKAREGKVSYSMDYRDGEDSYDCSSSVYYALRSAGAVSAGWAVNTEYEHDWLIKNGYELIAENTECEAQRGDVFIWGRKGASAGAGGHTGIFVDSENIIHCNYRYNGITVNSHDYIWALAGQPYFYIYRLTNPDAQPEAPKKGWQSDDKGYWYARANGSYPKDQFEKIDGTWYYFDNSGEMATDWNKIADKWYYFSRDGAMVTGWVKYYDKWYYLDARNGDMKSDCFIKYNDGWYLLLPDGRMADKLEFTVEPDGLITAK